MWFATLVLGCGDGRTQHPTIDGIPIDPTVVGHVAARDAIDEGAARQRVVETLRLAAAARSADPDAEISAARREHLLRTARARLVLALDFEASHRPEDLPAQDPGLARARSQQRFNHPTLHHVCQIIAEPPGGLEGEALSARTSDRAWLDQAMQRMQGVRAHLEAILPLADAEACDLMMRDLPLEQLADDSTVTLRAEPAGGFDLEACAVASGPDGRCAEPRFAPEWVEVVRDGPVPGLRGPFATRFGVHVVLVREILPASSPGDAGFEAHVREAVYPSWRAAALGKWMATLRTRHAAMVALGAD